MNKKIKNISIISLVFVLFCCYIGRVIYINQNVDTYKIEIYKQGDFVEYGDNFFMTNAEELCGYSIKVTSAKLMKLQDYLESKNLSYDDYIKKIPTNSGYDMKYVLDIGLLIKNIDSKGFGIDMINTRVLASNYGLQCSSFLFNYVYPEHEGFMYLKLRENTEFEISLPYCLIPSDEAVLNEDDLTKDDLYLNLTQYPVKKMIKLYIEK